MKLKSAIVMIFSVPMLAFGGTTCFRAESKVSAKIPSVLCLEAIVEGSTESDLNVLSKDGSFPSKLQITDFSHHNGERLNFSATGILVDNTDSVCSYSFQAKVIVKSEIAYGVINLKKLNVTVETEEMNDSCHSYPNNEVIKYTLQ